MNRPAIDHFSLHPDAVIQNSDGTVGVWYLAGTQKNQVQSFTVIAGPSNWTVVGVADMDGDGHPDLIIRNTDGTLGIWFLGGSQGNQIAAFNPLTTPGNTDWKELVSH